MGIKKHTHIMGVKLGYVVIMFASYMYFVWRMSW